MKHYMKPLFFDADITDDSGRVISIDAEINLPMTWDEKSKVKIAIPCSEMPISNFKNPFKLISKNLYPGRSIELTEVWYRHLTRTITPSRLHGGAAIELTHISGMKVIEEIPTNTSTFKIIISNSDFLNKEFTFLFSSNSLEDLVNFNCPRMGEVILQRYSTKSKSEENNGYISKYGYALSVKPNSDLSTHDMVNLSEPILKLFSIFFRQKVSALGWEFIDENKWERYWDNPLEPFKSNYTFIGPKRFLSSSESLSNHMKYALRAYYDLDSENKKILDKIIKIIRMPIKINDSNFFMSMYSTLEAVAIESTPKREITESEKNASIELNKLSDLFKEKEPKIYDRVKGFAKVLVNGKKPPVECIKSLLSKNSVQHADLWSLGGDKGLKGIRDTIAHGGLHKIHPQAIHVAAFHLNLLLERLALSLLKINYSKDMLQSGNDEWLDPSFIHKLKKDLFRPPSDFSND